MSEDSFMADLIAAIDATGATLGFDAPEEVMKEN
ncbi:MAG: hypothetical protein Ct9H90mP7_1730 [Candidatus Neomarinimicrobiota bacterium]|nr:MAG: hypothetical protein Ct9H90mP7_1730 [Candidatus Neomarinimicrobiota bacterium]